MDVNTLTITASSRQIAGIPPKAGHMYKSAGHGAETRALLPSTTALKRKTS